MNKRLLALLDAHPERYPTQLAARFPHVLDAILLLWGQPETNRYFERLLLIDRGERHGFPPQAIQEIEALRELHEQQHPRRDSHFDAWGLAPGR